MKDDLIRKLASGISDRHIKKYADFAAEKDGLKTDAKTNPAESKNASDGLKTPFLAAGEVIDGGKSNKGGRSGVREKRSGRFGAAWKVAASIAAVLILIVAGILVGQYFRTSTDSVVTVPPLISPESTALPTITQIDTDTPAVTPSVTDEPAPTEAVTPTVIDTPTATVTLVPTLTDTPTATAVPTSTATPTVTADPTSTATSTATAVPTTTATPTSTADPTSTAAPTAAVEPTQNVTLAPTDDIAPTATPTNTDAPAEVLLNESNFPDSEFREYIKKNFDLNKDAVLSDGEIKLITMLNVYYNYKSIKGIEYFYALESLYFNGVAVKSLDLSLVPNISILYIGFAPPYVSFTEVLEELDISKNHKLNHLIIRSNLITELDLSGNYELQNVDLEIPSLTKLDLSYNTDLESFALKNMTLSELDLSHNSNLVSFDIRECDIGNFIINDNNAIKHIYLIDSGIEELDLKHNEVIDYLLYIGGDRLDVSRCPNMRNAYLYGTYTSFYHAFDDYYTPAYEYPDDVNASTITLVTDCKDIYTG